MLLQALDSSAPLLCLALFALRRVSSTATSTRGHQSHQPDYEASPSRPNSSTFTTAQSRNELYPYPHLGGWSTTSPVSTLGLHKAATACRSGKQWSSSCTRLACRSPESLRGPREHTNPVPWHICRTRISEAQWALLQADLVSFQPVYGSGGMILYGTLLLRDFEAYKESLTGQAKCSLPTSEDIAKTLIKYKIIKQSKPIRIIDAATAHSMQTSRKGSRLLEKALCICTIRALGASMGQKRMRRGS